MKIEKFKELENKIEGKNYEKANFSKNIGWFLISWFFQILNIGISFFGLHGLLTSFFDVNNSILDVTLLVLPILILFAVEFLKRDTIKSTVFIIKNKQWNKLYSIGLLLICLVGFSAFFAIDGAKEISSKETQIENKLSSNIDSVRNVIDSTYASKIEYKISQIEKREERVDKIYESAKYWDGRTRSLNKNETDNIDKLSKEISSLNEEIDNLKNEKEVKINKLETEIKSKGESEISKNTNKSNIFLIIVFVIETFIVVGVSYTALFQFISFKQNKSDENFQKLLVYMKLLRILYQDGDVSKNSKIIGNKRLTVLFRDNNEDMSENDTKKFMDILDYLNIVKTQGNRKITKLDFEEAKIALQNYITKNI